MNTTLLRSLLTTVTASVFALTASARPPSSAPAFAAPAAPMRAPFASSLPPAATTHAAMSAQANAPSAHANASTGAAVSASAREIGATVRADQSAGTPMETRALVENIHRATFATRETVAAEISSRLAENDARLQALQARVEQAESPSRAALARALHDVRAAEKELRSSLRAATKETDESRWGAVQSALARDYSTYARTVIAAEAAAESKPRD